MAELIPSSNADNSLSRDALAERIKQLEAELAACQDSIANTSNVLASALKHNLSATAVFDINMCYVAASDKWLANHGLDDDVIGQSHYDVTSDISDEWRQIHKRCLAGAHESNLEDSYLHHDGSIDWISWSVYPWFNTNGSIAGIVISSDIVNERIQIREEARVFRKLVEASSDGIIISNIDNTITYANNAYKHMLGLTTSQKLVGTSLADHVVADVTENNTLDDINATTWQEGQWQGVVNHKRTSGDIFPAQVNSFAMRDALGTLTKRAALYQDISNQQELLHMVSENEQRLEMIVQHLPVMLFVTDTHGTITLSEGRELTHLGLRPGEVVGQSIFDYYRDVPIIISNVQQALNGKEVTFETHHAKHDQHFERYFAPLKTAEGKVTGMIGIAYNITESKRAKADLEAWKRRYDLVVASTGQAIYEYDITSGNIDWSQSVQDILGHSVETMNAGGITFWQTLLHPDDAETAVSELERATSNAEHYYIEYRLRHADDTYVDILESGLCTTDEHGKAVTMIGMLQDISKRKAAEQALKTSEMHLKVILSSLPIVVFTTDKEGIFTSSEGKALSTLGLESGQVVGFSLFEFYSSEHDVIDKVKRALAGETLAYESNTAGQYFENYYVPFIDDTNTVTGMLCVAYNITARKQSEQALEEERSRLLALYKAVPDTIIRVNREGTYLDYKPANYFGTYKPPLDTIGKNVRDNSPPEVAQQAFESIEALFASGEMQSFENMLIVSGEARYRENRFVKLNDNEVIVFVRDVTDLKRTEAALRESQQFLEDAQSMGKLGGWSFDLVTQKLYWSKQIYDICEVPYDTELTVELAISIYVDPIAIEDAMAKATKTHEPYDIESEIITLQGNYRWVRSIGKPIVEDGKVVKLVGTHQDITDTKQVQAQLLESQQFLEDAQSMGKMGSWSFDLATQEIFWSKQIYDTMEAPYDSELTTPFLMSFYADATILQNAMADAVNDGKPYDLELEITTLKGNKRWVRAIGRPVFENSKVIKLVGTQQDITDTKQAELGLQVVNDRLARLNSLTTQLNQVDTLDAMLDAVLTTLANSTDLVATTTYPIYDETDTITAVKLIAVHNRGNFNLPMALSTIFPIEAYPSIDLYLHEPERVTFIDDVDQDARLHDDTKRALTDIGVAAQAFITLQQGTRVIALVGINSAIKTPFSEEDVAFLSALPTLLSPIVANRQLLDSLEQTVQERTKDLQQSQALLNGFFAHAPGCVWVKDLDLRFMMANQASDIFYGRAAKDVIGLSDLDIFDNLKADEFGQAERSVIATKQAVTLEENAPSSLGMRNLVTTKFPIFDEAQQVIAIGGLSTDVTELTQELQRSQAILRGFLDNAPALMYVKDTNLQFMMVNTKVAASYDTTIDQVLGKSDHDFFEPEVASQFSEIESGVLATRQSLVIEQEVPASYGVRHFITAKFPIIDQQGTLQALGGFSFDTTEMRREVYESQQQLRQTNTTLSRLGELSQALNQVTSKQQLLEVVSQIAFVNNANSASLFDLDITHTTGQQPETGTLAASIHAQEQPQQAMPVGTSVRFSDFPSSELWLENYQSVFYVADIVNDSRIDNAIKEISTQLNNHAYVVIPLVQNERWIGFLNFTWGSPRNFTNTELQIYNALISLVPPALASLNIVADLEHLVEVRSSELTASNTRLALLNNASTQLSGADSFDSMLQTLSELFSGEFIASVNYPLFHADGSVRGTQLISHYDSSLNISLDVPVGTKFLIEAFPAISVYVNDSSGVTIFDDVATDLRADENSRKLLTEAGVVTVVYLTLRQAGQIIAFVSIAWKITHTFTADETTYLNALPSLLAPVVANLKSLQGMAESNERLAVLNYISTQLSAASRLEDLLEIISEPLSGDFAVSVSYPTFDDTNAVNALELVGQLNPTGNSSLDFPVGTQFPLDTFPAIKTYINEPSGISLIADLYEDKIVDPRSKAFYDQLGLRANAYLALRQADQIIAFVNISWLEPHPFSDSEQTYLHALPALLAPVVANLKSLEDLAQSNANLAIINRIGSQLKAADSKDKMLEILLEPLSATSKTHSGETRPHSSNTTDTPTNNSVDTTTNTTTDIADNTDSVDVVNTINTIDTDTNIDIAHGFSNLAASLFYVQEVDNLGNVTTIQLVSQHTPAEHANMNIGITLDVAFFPGVNPNLHDSEATLFTEDVASDSHIDSATRALLTQFGVATLVTIPLIQSDQWVGILTLSWFEQHTFSAAERVYLQALPTILTPPLANRRMVETLEETVIKRNEELAKSRQLLRATIDNAPIIVSVKDTSFRYVLANKHLSTITPGITFEDIIGLTDHDIFPSHLADKTVDSDRRVLAARQALAYEETREIDGTTRTYLFNKFPLLDDKGNVFAIGLVANDITEQQEQERKMQAYRDQLAQAEAELQITQRIQELLLPVDDELAAIDGLDIASYMQPAEQVGGDYYDILQIGDSVKFGIGDVTGHGLESGLLMLMTQTAVRTLLSSNEHDPKRIMSTLNRIVFDNLQRMQVDKSLTLSLLDYDQGTLRLSGQHEHVLVIRGSGTVEAIDTIDLGMPLGLEEDISHFIAEKMVHLDPGEGVVLFTDGITEAENDGREQFGLARLIELIEKHWQQPAQVITDAIIQAVYDHVNGHIIYDDITLVVFKRPSGDFARSLVSTQDVATRPHIK